MCWGRVGSCVLINDCSPGDHCELETGLTFVHTLIKQIRVNLRANTPACMPAQLCARIRLLSWWPTRLLARREQELAGARNWLARAWGTGIGELATREQPQILSMYLGAIGSQFPHALLVFFHVEGDYFHLSHLNNHDTHGLHLLAHQRPYIDLSVFLFVLSEIPVVLSLSLVKLSPHSNNLFSILNSHHTPALSFPGCLRTQGFGTSLQACSSSNNPVQQVSSQSYLRVKHSKPTIPSTR